MEKKLPYVLIIPVIGYLLSLTVFPLIYSLVLSFHSFNLANPTAGMRFVGIDNFIEILKDVHFWASIRNSFIYTVSSVAFSFFIGFGLALLFNREIRGKNILRTMVIIPMMLTPAVIGLFWRLLLNADFGPINYYLGLIGIPRQNWLGNPSLALPTVIFVDIWQWSSFVFLILFAGLQAIPLEPLEAAKVDGASPWQILRYITVPLLKPAILVVLLLRIIDAFREFDKIYVLTLGGPGFATETLSLYIYKKGFKWFDMGYASALSYIMLIIVVIISTLFIRVLSEEV